MLGGSGVGGALLDRLLLTAERIKWLMGCGIW